MLITNENILHRFSEHLSWATEIDLATAWATSNGGLRALQRRVPSLEVRAVVGLWGNLTEPFALKILANMGQLRAADASRRFHPKVFVFRAAGRSVAWVGSANFTSGGFGMNEEALFETSDTASVQNWLRRYRFIVSLPSAILREMSHWREFQRFTVPCVQRQDEMDRRRH